MTPKAVEFISVSFSARIAALRQMGKKAGMHTYEGDYAPACDYYADVMTEAADLIERRLNELRAGTVQPQEHAKATSASAAPSPAVVPAGETPAPELWQCPICTGWNLACTAVCVYTHAGIETPAGETPKVYCKHGSYGGYCPHCDGWPSDPTSQEPEK